jgi:hypothetical protein
MLSALQKVDCILFQIPVVEDNATDTRDGVDMLHRLDVGKDEGRQGDDCYVTFRGLPSPVNCVEAACAALPAAITYISRRSCCRHSAAHVSAASCIDHVDYLTFVFAEFLATSTTDSDDRGLCGCAFA